MCQKRPLSLPVQSRGPPRFGVFWEGIPFQFAVKSSPFAEKCLIDSLIYGILKLYKVANRRFIWVYFFVQRRSSHWRIRRPIALILSAALAAGALTGLQLGGIFGVAQQLLQQFLLPAPPSQASRPNHDDDNDSSAPSSSSSPSSQPDSSSSQGAPTYTVTINGEPVTFTEGKTKTVTLADGSTLKVTISSDGTVSGSITPADDMAIKSVNIGNNDEPVDVDKRLNYPFDLTVADLSNLGNVTIEFAERKTVKVTPPTAGEGTITVTFNGSAITQDTPIIEGDPLTVIVTAGRSHEITSVTVGSKKYDATDEQKKSMTVPYTVPVANNGMAALFSSGSTEITVSAIFALAIVEDDPTTWKIENNTLIVPEDVNDSLINANLFNDAGGNFTGIDLSDTQITTIGDSAFEGCEKLTTVTPAQHCGHH